MANQTPHKDEVTGTETTGHEWDEIRELNTPLPRWWIYTFYATVIWAIGYWIVMPAWPVFIGEWTYTPGVLGYSQRGSVAEEVSQAEATRAVYGEKIAATPLTEIAQDAELLEVALAAGRAAFGDNCAPCHGSGAQGGTGFPNLNDDDWLWGGALADIQQTLLHGIRWEPDEDTRFSLMPRFLTDGLLSREQVNDVTDYVLSLSGNAGEADPAAISRGAEVFAQQCASCHGPDGKGMQEMGSPNLTDNIWLYGGDRESVHTTIAQSRRGVMPAWGSRLDDQTIKEITLYVHSLGGGQ